MKRAISGVIVLVMFIMPMGINAVGHEKELLKIKLEKGETNKQSIYNFTYKNPQYCGIPKTKSFKVTVENSGNKNIQFEVLHNGVRDHSSYDGDISKSDSIVSGNLSHNKSKILEFKIPDTIQRSKQSISVILTSEDEGEGLLTLYKVGDLCTKEQLKQKIKELEEKVQEVDENNVGLIDAINEHIKTNGNHKNDYCYICR